MNNNFSATIEGAFKSNKFVILDTETTGLRYPAEIIEICVLDFMGDRIVDTRVKPKRKIPADATKIHGITDADVASAPSWIDVRRDVIEALRDKHLIIYNSDYDLNMLHWTDKLHGISFDWQELIKQSHCAMLWYAEFHGEVNEYYGSYRWQKLSNACRKMGVDVVDAHCAYADARMTHQLINAVIRVQSLADIAESMNTDPECLHPVVDDSANGDRVCRDCGKTWTV